MKNHFQALKNTSYPTIPAIWPNRSIRRALRYSRALPTQWAAFFDMHPEHRVLAKAQG